MSSSGMERIEFGSQILSFQPSVLHVRRGVVSIEKPDSPDDLNFPAAADTSRRLHSSIMSVMMTKTCNTFSISQIFSQGDPRSGNCSIAHWLVDVRQSDNRPAFPQVVHKELGFFKGNSHSRKALTAKFSSELNRRLTSNPAANSL